MALIKRLRLDSKPAGVDANGDLMFEPNSSGKDYIVYDVSQEAPPGFGIRVAKKKTFVIRRKVHGKSCEAAFVQWWSCVNAFNASRMRRWSTRSKLWSTRQPGAGG